MTDQPRNFATLESLRNDLLRFKVILLAGKERNAAPRPVSEQATSLLEALVKEGLDHLPRDLPGFDVPSVVDEFCRRYSVCAPVHVWLKKRLDLPLAAAVPRGTIAQQFGAVCNKLQISVTTPKGNNANKIQKKVLRPVHIQPKRAVPEGSFFIDWTVRTGAGEWGSKPYILQYKGTLKFSAHLQPTSVPHVGGVKNDVTAGSVAIGHVTCRVFKMTEIANDGEDLLTVCEGLSEEIYQAAEKIIEMEEKTGKSFDDGCYVEELFVDAAWRGLGLGLFMLSHVQRGITCLTSYTLLAANPHWFSRSNVEKKTNKRIRYESTAQAKFDHDVEKLQMYYSRIGFEKIGDLFVGLFNRNGSRDISSVCPHLLGRTSTKN